MSRLLHASSLHHPSRLLTLVLCPLSLSLAFNATPFISHVCPSTSTLPSSPSGGLSLSASFHRIVPPPPPPLSLSPLSPFPPLSVPPPPFPLSIFFQCLFPRLFRWTDNPLTPCVCDLSSVACGAGVEACCGSPLQKVGSLINNVDVVEECVCVLTYTIFPLSLSRTYTLPSCPPPSLLREASVKFLSRELANSRVEGGSSETAQDGCILSLGPVGYDNQALQWWA